MRMKQRNIMETPLLGVLDVVQIVLIVLKLTRVIDWSWWVVLIPLWLCLGTICVLAIAMITEYHKNEIDGAW